MKPPSRLWILAPILASAATVVLMQAKCGTPGQVPEKHGVRIAAYNLEWLSEHMSSGRAAHLRSVIKNINPDIIAMEEVENRNALSRIFDSNWQFGIMDDPEEFQEPAIAVRWPLRLVGKVQTLFPGDAFEFAFPGGRDVLRARVQTKSGLLISVYVCHMKSRREGRKQTDSQRIMAAGLLAAYLRGVQGEPYAVVLGDFNDTPDDESLNVLESGNLLARGEASDKTGPLLFNLMQPLVSRDCVTLGMRTLFRGSSMEPVVKGARDENNKWRNKEFRFPDDLAVSQVLFDQILVSRPMSEVQIGEAQIYAGKDALEGEAGRTQKASNGRVTYLKQGTLASDHLPVFADFRLPN